ncbi:MAG: SGNH/GDSL hydrolase family protein [Pirellulales bacterium]|nr:SGNH/GDSL hydrolase family protein [Pirellulales bacterium]
MTTTRLIGSAALALAMTLGLPQDGMAAQQKTQPQQQAQSRQPRALPPALAPIDDDPTLPRVLLIGDSISIGYMLPVRAALAGKANVHRPPTNCGPTIRGLEQIDRWLGEGRWDVIHFNWGLHDLKFIEGKRQVPLVEYEKNLQRLVARMKKTGARLIWCSTTPVPKGCSPPRTNDDVVAYNAVAKKIMDANGIAIDDLYGFALPRLAEIQLPANVHFTPKGSKTLAGQVAASIRVALEKEDEK